MKKIYSLLFATLILAGCNSKPAAPGKYAEVAQCLTDKGVIFYGAFWCPHCANQKARFGEDIQYVTYQECDDKGKGGNHALCLEKGVTSYPTWFFPGLGNLPGEQEVRNLAKLSNCVDKLPAEDKALLESESNASDLANAATETTSTETSSEPK